MDEKKKTPGTGRGTGRRPGSKNKISTEVKQDIAEFFRTCTSENIRWRQNMRRKLEMAATSREFFNLSRLALSYAHGLPGKMQDTTKPRESLVFLTTNGMVPWDPRADSMREITDAMILGKEQELKALEAAKEPVTIDVKADHDSETPESLELVQEPPQDFTGGRR